MERRKPRMNAYMIDLVARWFGTHAAGLPEWVKNAREAYVREGVEDIEQRWIIINLLGSGSKGTCRGVECIDFVGVDADEIDAKYLEWAKPDAASEGVEDPSLIEGGQGNGGKAYGRQLFERFFFASIRDGKLSVVAFVDEEKHILDFIDGARGTTEESRAFAGGVRAYANKILEQAGRPAGSNITIVRGEGPKDLISTSRVAALLPRSPQARETLRTCDVRIFVAGKQQKILKLEAPPAHKDFPGERIIAVPEVLPDYNDDPVRTTKPGFGPGSLTLRVAALRMRPGSGQWPGWSAITIRGEGVRSIGEWPTGELDLPRPDMSNHVYGDLRVPLLTDPADMYELQARQRIKDGPLSNALKRFVEAEVAKLLGEMEKLTAENKVVEKKKALEKLHELFERWIDTKLAGFEGTATEGTGEGEGKKEREKGEKKVHAPLASLRIHREELTMCLGTSYRLRANGKDADGKPVPAGEVEWNSSDPAVVQIDSMTGEMIACGAGECVIGCDSMEVDGISAAPAAVRVIKAIEIEILNEEPLEVGPNRRTQVHTTVLAADGATEDDVVVTWTVDDENCAGITQDSVLLGRLPGTTVAVASAGDVKSAPIEIVVEAGKHGDADRPTSSKPRILISNVHPDPRTGELFTMPATNPPVHQRNRDDVDTNTWWINLQSPLAEALSRFGWDSLQWRTYHFQRMIDVWVRLKLFDLFAGRTDLGAEDLVNEYDDFVAGIYTDAAQEDIFNVLSGETIAIEDDDV
jgi:hypothetical protein